MNSFTFYMPCKLFYGQLSEHAGEFAGYGKRALIITGKSSAKNGSLDDTLACLKENGLGYSVFNEVEENPSLTNVETAAAFGKKEGCDFIVAVGGGSPMDASKAVSVLMAQPGRRADELHSQIPWDHLPLLAVPTTAGTGSEATPFSVLTIPDKKTKASMTPMVFFDKAFLNEKYTKGLPESITFSTALDVLAHLVEGYLSSRSNPFTDMLAEGGLVSYGRCMKALAAREYEPLRGELLRLSSLGGMVISAAKTSIPHIFGYSLTVCKSVPHGYATAFFLAEYLKFHENREKSERVCQLLGVSGADELKAWIRGLIGDRIDLTEDEIRAFVEHMWETRAKLQAHPYPVSIEDIEALHRDSLKI